ncbi:Cytochrome c [Stieleria magnilauensis]|uniref:Cytochrome c n=2 Tax=Stieleria magnilauensis TaxID=2527963 RepID=A0ABX5XLQ4_9BACT|nr:Cytochrome c [Planctomycetes bacterium TBK1r]
MSAEQYLWESIVFPDRFKAVEDGQMPNGYDAILSNRELKDLVAYLSSLGSSPNFRNVIGLADAPQTRQATDGLTLKLTNIENGRQLFTETFQCQSCHGWGEHFAGQDLAAPSLNGVGLMGRDWLTTSIRDPSKQIAKKYRSVQCLTEDGDTHVGRLLSQDDARIELLSQDASGKYHIRKLKRDELVEIRDGSEVLIRDTSPMPAWTSQQMSDSQLDDIVSFLLTLRD